MKKKILGVLNFLVVYVLSINAQLTVNPNQSAANLAQQIIGAGVTITNATLNCTNTANAIVNSTNTNLGITSGIVLTTGRAQTSGSLIGLNGLPGVLANNNNGLTAPDANLSSLTTATQFDVCALQFNVVPAGDTLYLRYLFSSEEYPTFNCTQFNDVFGIFVSGPGITGTTNFAKVPGTNINVSINSINNGVPAGNITNCSSLGAGSPFTSLYVNNLGSSISHNGFTQPLIARIPVVAGSTYLFKAAIADVSDGSGDSGFFIESSSLFSQPLISLEPFSSDNTNTKPIFAKEGCNPARVRVNRPPNNSALNVSMTFSGNATLNNDFTMSTANTFTIPAGTTSFDVNLNALVDNIIEPNDSVKIKFTAVGFGYSDSVIIYIRDFAPNLKVFNNSNDTTVCSGNAVPLYVTGFTSPYTFQWISPVTLQNDNTLNPILNHPTVNNSVTRQITFRISHPGCSSRDSIINVTINPVPTIFFNSGKNVSICKGDTFQVNTSVLPSNGAYLYSWTPNLRISNTSATNPKMFPIASQKYILNVTDPAGCGAKDSVNISVSQIDSEILSIVSDSTKCGIPNGKITINVNNATPNYLYSLNNGNQVSGNVFSNLASGNYSVSIRNGANCKIDTIINIKSGAPGPSVSLVVLATTCGQNNGKIKANVTGGKAPYNYSWSNNVVNKDSIINLTAGNYNLTVSDANNCIITQSIIVPASNGVNNIVNKSNTACGLNNGSINVAATNGLSPFTFLWSNGSTTSSLSNLTSGRYFLTITDANNCIKKDTVFIDSSSNLSFTKNVIQTTCNNSNGSISYNILKGVNPISFSWSNGTTLSSNTNLSSGQYIVTITDNALCSKIDTTIILPSSSPSAQRIFTNPKCGLSNGKIKLTNISGIAPLSFLWSNGTTLDSIQNLSAGAYSVTITDPNGCNASLSIPLTMTSNPSINFNKVNTTCGINNGAIFTSISNAINPITYNWSNGATSSSINNLQSGTYILTITDSLGCLKIDSTIILPSNPFNVSYTVVQPLCKNNFGSISSNIVSGKSPFKFSWKDGSTLSNRLNISPNTYIVLAEDSNKCFKRDTFVINPPTNPVISLSVKHASCGLLVGSIKANVSLGKSPYTFLWSTGATTDSISNLPHSQNYSLTVTDADGCIDSISAKILFAPSPTFQDSFRNVRCGLTDNGFIRIYNIVSPFSFSVNWNHGPNSPFVGMLPVGSYSVNITDTFGCQVSKTFNILDDGIHNVFLNQVRPTCNKPNGRITAVPSGGKPPYSILWSNGKTTFVNDSIPHGIYTASVLDANNCLVSENLDLKNQTPIKVDFDSVPSRCDSNTGVLFANVSNGTPPFKYIWGNNDSLNFADSLSIGLHTLRVIDSNGCIFDTFSEINYIYDITGTIDSFKLATCGLNNGYLKFSIDTFVPPLVIRWNGLVDSSYVRSNLSSQNYTIFAEDSNKCRMVISQDLNGGPPIIISSSVTTPVHCNLNDGTITIGLTGDSLDVYPPTFQWSNSKITQNNNNLAIGNYSVTVTDRYNCIDTQSFSIINDIPSTINLDTIASTCSLNNGLVRLLFSDENQIDSIFWNTNQFINLKTIPNAAPGIYRVRVNDIFGCNYLDTITLSAVPFPIIQINKTNSNCLNGIGKIKANVVNGSPPYTFFWNNFTSNDSLVNLQSGNYSLTVTDSKGCQKDTTVSIIYNQPPLLNLSKIDDACQSNIGSVSTSVFNGTAPFSFLWNNGSVSSNLTNISSGFFSVTVTDINNCSETKSVNVTSTPKPIANYTVSNATCNLNNGSILVALSGGKTPFNISWSNLSTSLNQINLDSGTLIFNVIDSNLCQIKDTLKVTRQPSISLSLSKIDENCSASNGSINTNINGGTLPITFLWNNGSTSQNLTNIKAGLYSVSATDALGCSFSSSIVINDSAGPNTSVINTPATCGQNNGSINVSVFNGNPPFQFFWNNVLSPNASLQNINGGTFFFKVIDAKGCQKIDTIIRNSAGDMSLSFNSNPPNCGLNNGFVKVNPLNALPPIFYNWSSGSISDSIFNLVPGKYIVTATDATSCIRVDSITINRVNAPVINFQNTSATCANADGKIKTTISGGLAPFTYLWSNASNSDSLINVTAGNYTLTITDKLKCSVNSTVNLSTSGITSINANIKQPSCEKPNGRIKVVPVGGTIPYSYQWNIVGNSDSIINLPPSSYNLTVTDANGCQFSSNYLLNNIPSPILTASVSDASCGANNGLIQTSITSGTSPFIYSWSHNNLLNNPLATSLGNGLYRVIVFDGNNCSDTMNLNVGRIPDIFVQDSIVKSTCGDPNGKIFLKTSGGQGALSLGWSNGASTASINNLNAGFYSVLVQDASGCSKFRNYEVLNIPKPFIQTVTSDVVCGVNNGSISASVAPNTGTSPFSYTWSNGATGTNSIQNLSTGIYKVTVTDSLNCKDSTTVSIAQGVDPTLSLTKQDVVCTLPNGFIEVATTRLLPPITYLWNTNDTTIRIENLLPGTYSILVRDGRNCSLRDTILINDQPAPIIKLNGTSSYCNRNTGRIETVDSLGKKPFTYLWSNGVILKDNINISKGNYRVTITDANGCIVRDSLNINDLPDNLKITNAKVNDLKCFGENTGSVEVTVSDGNLPYSYSVKDSLSQLSNILTNLFAQEYIIKVEDNLGCFRFDTVRLTQPTNRIVKTENKVNLRCFNEPEGLLEVSVTGGKSPYSFNWPSLGVSGPKVSNLAKGQYQVRVVDANNCVTLYTDSVSQPEELFIVDSLISNPKCTGDQNGKIELSFNGGIAPYAFIWSDGSNSRINNALPSGNHFVAVTDANGCLDTFRYRLVDPSPIGFLSIKTLDVPCPDENNGELILEGKGGQGAPYQFSIDSGKTFSFTKFFRKLDSGKYIFAVRDSNGCTLFDSTIIRNAERIAILANPKIDTINLGESLEISYDVIEGKAERINEQIWTSQEGLECNTCAKTIAQPYKSSQYIVEVTYNGNRCKTYDTIQLIVLNNNPFYIPNIFNPLNEKENIFKVYGLGIKYAYLSVFNRWGEKVFDTENAIINGWDGTYKGSLVAPEVYYYKAQIFYLNGEIKTEKGDITLIR